MEGSNRPSHYVRLRKEKDPVEDITPGELNQPVNVPQVCFIYIYIFQYCYFLIIILDKI